MAAPETVPDDLKPAYERLEEKLQAIEGKLEPALAEYEAKRAEINAMSEKIDEGRKRVNRIKVLMEKMETTFRQASAEEPAPPLEA